MKIEFDDGGSLEMKIENNEVYVIISAPSFSNPNELIVNAASLTIKQLEEVLSDVLIKPDLAVENSVVEEKESIVEDIEPAKVEKKKVTKKVSKKVNKKALKKMLED